ncbi:MAG: hypothetical protein LBD88_04955 [Candidatus Peribacteria bacterium]|jgi:fructose-1,6-bisphosphatase|nr:hypothetical protein [Candidatus Peribacteria bacterium]
MEKSYKGDHISKNKGNIEKPTDNNDNKINNTTKELEEENIENKDTNKKQANSVDDNVDDIKEEVDKVMNETQDNENNHSTIIVKENENIFALQLKNGSWVLLEDPVFKSFRSKFSKLIKKYLR